MIGFDKRLCPDSTRRQLRWLHQSGSYRSRSPRSAVSGERDHSFNPRIAVLRSIRLNRQHLVIFNRGSAIPFQGEIRVSTTIVQEFVSAVQTNQEYIPVHISSLRVDSITGFDLYLRVRPDEPSVSGGWILQAP